MLSPIAQTATTRVPTANTSLSPETAVAADRV